MSFKINTGKSDFEKIRKGKSYYVDKTEFIYELVNNTDNMVSLFTRPRRFGKTLMMSTLENFFSVRKESSSIFEGLSIIKYTDFCKSWMNQYPVILISFKEVDAADFNLAYEKLKTIISDLYTDFADIKNNPKVDSDDVNRFSRLKSGTASDSEVQYSLKILMRMLHACYGKEVILLIDEYDVPLAKAQKNGYYDKMLDVIRGMMSSSLKDNKFLQFAVVTGCLRIAKESIFTGTNNFATYSVLDKKFSSYFGFSTEEVQTILKCADRVDKASLIKEWYDGYVFGDSFVYCPWDVVRYVSNLINYPELEPQNYWKNTSHNDILLSFAKRTDFSVSSRFETLLNGGVIQQTITDTITYDSLYSSEDNLWSVLLMSGYLTKADPTEQGSTVTLRIPNKEIASIFEDTVITLFKETIDTSRQKALMEALWSGDEKTSTNLVSDFLLDTISFHDYHEDYYHAFLTGIFVGLGYEVESNKELGLGRPDLQVKDPINHRLLVIEAKKSFKESDMDTDCDKAASQIIEKGYNQRPAAYNTILCYAVSFFQKQAKLKLVYKDSKKT